MWKRWVVVVVVVVYFINLYLTISLDVCGSWIVRNGICYKRFEGTMTAGEAVSLCESQNAYLQEIPNIYVNNIITEVIGENECWSGLRTNATHYYWRIGDFPLGEDVPADVDECGTVDYSNGNRWKLRNCSIMLCAICMIGKQSFGYSKFVVWLQIELNIQNESLLILIFNCMDVASVYENWCGYTPTGNFTFSIETNRGI